MNRECNMFKKKLKIMFLSKSNRMKMKKKLKEQKLKIIMKKINKIKWKKKMMIIENVFKIEIHFY